MFMSLESEDIIGYPVSKSLVGSIVGEVMAYFDDGMPGCR